MHKHLRRLNRYYTKAPLYFITTCTHQRKPILANKDVVSILLEEWREGLSRHGWITGRYVVMPDHVHFFCTPSGENAKTLSGYIQAWKQWTSKRFIRERGGCSPVWQAGFFDHVLRSTKSAKQKWEYIIENPVRAGLVTNTVDWPWQGEVYTVEMLI